MQSQHFTGDNYKAPTYSIAAIRAVVKVEN
jgi:hypothetical protein